MLPVLQLYHISQYEFEEFCDKWVFQFYEKAVSGKFIGDYEAMWKDFEKIEPNNNILYSYTTKLETKVTFFPSSDRKWETFFTYKTKQL